MRWSWGQEAGFHSAFGQHISPLGSAIAHMWGWSLNTCRGPGHQAFCGRSSVAVYGHSQHHKQTLISVGTVCSCCDSDAGGRLRAEARGNQVPNVSAR